MPAVQLFMQSMVFTQVDTRSQSADSGSTHGLPKGRLREIRSLKSTLIHTSLCAQTLPPRLSHFTSSPFIPRMIQRALAFQLSLGNSSFKRVIWPEECFFHGITQDRPVKSADVLI